MFFSSASKSLTLPFLYPKVIGGGTQIEDQLSSVKKTLVGCLICLLGRRFEDIRKSCLFDIGDYTTQLYGDYNKPISQYKEYNDLIRIIMNQIVST